MSGLPSELTLVLRVRVNYRTDLTLVRFIAVNCALIEFHYKASTFDAHVIHSVTIQYIIYLSNERMTPSEVNNQNLNAG